MNCTSTSPNIVVSSPLQRTQFFIAFISPGSTHTAEQLNRGDISGDLIDFSFAYTALRTVKGTEE